MLALPYFNHSTIACRVHHNTDAAYKHDYNLQELHKAIINVTSHTHQSQMTALCIYYLTFNVPIFWTFAFDNEKYLQNISIPIHHTPKFRNLSVKLPMPWVTLLRRPAHSGWLQGVALTGIRWRVSACSSNMYNGRALDDRSSSEAAIK